MHKLLVVDNDYDAIVDDLSSDDYIIDGINNYDDEIDIIKLKIYDLIIIDINLQVNNVLAISKSIKLCNKCCDTPILFLTSTITDDLFSQISNYTNVDYILKPLKLAELLFKIKNILALTNEKNNLLKQNKVLSNNIDYTFKQISGLKLKSCLLEEESKQNDLILRAVLADTSHEIRTPLNIILGFSQLLAEGENDAKIREEYSASITKYGEILLRIIDDILDYSKIKSGLLNLNVNKMDLHQLLNNLFILFKSKTNENLNLKLNIDASESFYINADDLRLYQVFSNMIGNAFKFTESGEIVFGYDVIDNKIHFFVLDSGRGIPEDKVDEVFVSYKQLNEKDNLSQGVGLGLAICKRLVALMGGEIKVESKVGIGTKFSFTVAG